MLSFDILIVICFCVDLFVFILFGTLYLPGITSWQIDGETMETVRDFIFGVPKSLQMVTAAMKLKDSCFLEEKL